MLEGNLAISLLIFVSSLRTLHAVSSQCEASGGIRKLHSKSLLKLGTVRLGCTVCELSLPSS